MRLQAPVLLALLSMPALSCGPKAADPDRDTVHDVVDEVDRCYLVRCSDLEDDGCPEFTMSFDDGASTLDDRHLPFVREMASDLEGIGDALRTLRLTGSSMELEADGIGLARANALKDALVAAGVDPARIEVDGAPGEATEGGAVWFEAICE